MGDMAVSNSIGSNVFDILIGLGLPWALQTLAVDYGSYVSGIFSLVTSATGTMSQGRGGVETLALRGNKFSWPSLLKVRPTWGRLEGQEAQGGPTRPERARGAPLM